MRENSRKRHVKGVLFLAVTILLFSTFEVTSKMIGSRIHPLQISFLRFLIGGVFLLGPALIRMKRTGTCISAALIADTALLGFVNIVVSMGLLQFGLLHTNASTGAVLFSSNPLFVVLFAAPLLGERITAAKTAGALTGITGVVIMFLDRISISSTGLRGALLAAASAVVFALYTVLGKRCTLKGTDSLVMTSFSFIAGSLFLLPLMIVSRIPLLPSDTSLIPPLLYLGIFVSGIAYMSYFYGLKNVDTGTGTLVFFFKPALATLLAVILLGEKLNTSFYIGTLFIFTALFISNYRALRNTGDR